jgi:hypothetical protein
VRTPKVSAEPHPNSPGLHLIVFTKQLFSVGTPRESALLPGFLSKRVKHNRIVECGHSQEINCITQHRFKACKTQ